jgi:hypothetical protein
VCQVTVPALGLRAVTQVSGTGGALRGGVTSPASRRLDVRLRRRAWAVLAAFAVLDAAGGCAGVGADAVPACPRCGAPRTYLAADGTPRVRTRMRLVDGRPPDVLLGLGPFALDRGDAAAAPPPGYLGE